MDKFCVFCGEKPEEKSAEHVIPRWLIELTGNPKRKAYFGYQHDIETKPKLRNFSFDAFQFPSCASCNQKYSSLEAATKSIIEKMLASDSLSAIDFNTLLDWFDKVRVGLWLGYQYLNKNPAGITPKFYIEKRIDVNDRMIAIFKTDTEIKGLTYIGCDWPSFTYTPSCFSLLINNLCLLNMSYNDLFSRRIGFPYPIVSYATTEQQQLGTYTWGRNRVMVPLLKKRFTIRGTQIYQPMFQHFISDLNARDLYDTKYVHENSMVWNEGRGKVFIQDNKLLEYPIPPSKDWVPKDSNTIEELLFKITIQTLEWQQYIDGLRPSPKKLPAQYRRNYISQGMSVRKANKVLLQFLMDRLASHQADKNR